MDTTSVSLLERLRLPGCQDAWSRFVKLYTPLLYYWAHRSGFPSSEADDLVQDVFTTLVKELPQFIYDRGGKFRAWLRTVALNKWNERRRRQAVGAGPLANEAVMDPRAPDPAEGFWAREYRQLLLRRALQLMQTDFPDTWKACYEVLVEGKKVPEVAAARGMTANALHQAKFRLVNRLRQELGGLLD